MKSQESKVFRTIRRKLERADPEPSATTSKEGRIAAGLELVLLGLLIAFLGVATVGFFRMLGRVDVSWVRGVPVGILFAGAGYFTARKARLLFRSLGLGKSEGNAGDR
jgi:hypothetical protein